MSRIDLVKLRKRAGLSQRELAGRLQVRPSFLSAIENGRSRIPEEKLDKIKEIFEIDSFDDYIIEDTADTLIHTHSHLPSHSHIPPHTHQSEQTDSIALLLNHFHELAHQRDKAYAESNPDSADRIDFLTKRNDRLSARVDDLRDEVDRLREECLRLKELLVKNGIEY